MDSFNFSTNFDQALLLGERVKGFLDSLTVSQTGLNPSNSFHTSWFSHQHHFLSSEPARQVTDSVLLSRSNRSDIAHL